MKYTFILLLLITPYGCDTKTQKPDESLPTFTLTNEFQYNKPIRSYDAQNGILKEWNGISFKQLPINAVDGESITCKYQLLGGASFEKTPSEDHLFGVGEFDTRWDLIRKVECTFGILDTSNGLRWEKRWVITEEILKLISMEFKIVDKTVVLTDSLLLEIAELSHNVVASSLQLHELKAQYDTNYNESEGHLSLMKELEELGNTFYAISFDNQTIATIHLKSPQTPPPPQAPPHEKSCAGVTYQSYNDWRSLARVKLGVNMMRIKQLKAEHGL
jgi:hypothetical protein